MAQDESQDREQRAPGAGTPAKEEARGEALDPSRAASRLVDVLDRALRLSSSSQDIDPAEAAALRAVGERHRGKELTVEPVACELVAAMLESFYRRRAPELWRRLARPIAATLLDDPASQERLEALWRSLNEAPR
jgi:hypothetical protein